MLDELVDDATVDGAPSPVALTLAEVRTTLAERLAGRPTTSSHRTGDLTFSTLVPMRSVPHRVVCLLGLDDGAFPRTTVADSDDLLAAAPRVGDRDARSEDRQLLLDALLAATETLVVTWAGRDVRTNEDRPPAVPVDELLDVIDRTVASPDERPPAHAPHHAPPAGRARPPQLHARGRLTGRGAPATGRGASTRRCWPPPPRPAPSRSRSPRSSPTRCRRPTATSSSSTTSWRSSSTRRRRSCGNGSS